MKIIIAAFVLLVSFSSMAQLGSSGISDARSTGLAGTYNSTAKGSYAIGINPANIIMTQFSGDLLFILPFPQVHFRTGSDVLTLNEFRYYFGGINGKPRVLTDQDVQELNKKFEGGGDLNFGFTANLISFSFNIPTLPGTVGFSINDVFAGNAFVPEEAARVALLGNELDRLYTFNSADFKSWWIRNYSLTYARDISETMGDTFDKLCAGISLKLIHGFFYAGSEHNNTFLELGGGNVIYGKIDFLTLTSISEDIGIKYDFDPNDRTQNNLQVFPAPAGSGFGMDLGVSAVYKKDWNFSLSLTDIGSISWKKRTARLYAKGDILINDLSDEEQRDSIAERIETDGEYISGFSTRLPLALRAGVSYQYDNLLLGFDYNQGFNDLPGNSTIPRFSVAGDLVLGQWISLRMGLSAGGIDGFNWAAGLGIQSGIIEFNLATTNFLFIPAPNNSKQMSISLNSRWRFR